MPECSGAPNESKPAKLNSRPITASCANVPPAPPYSSGIAGQRSPAAPALFQTSRSYRPSSFQVSRCGTYSAAMKRRACSSSSTRSSVIQPGRGTLRTFMRNPVDRTAYRAPLHYARATSAAKRLALFHSRRVAESRLANHLGLLPPPCRKQAGSARELVPLRLGRAHPPSTARPWPHLQPAFSLPHGRPSRGPRRQDALGLAATLAP